MYFIMIIKLIKADKLSDKHKCVKEKKRKKKKTDLKNKIVTFGKIASFEIQSKESQVGPQTLHLKRDSSEVTRG